MFMLNIPRYAENLQAIELNLHRSERFASVSSFLAARSSIVGTPLGIVLLFLLMFRRVVLISCLCQADAMPRLDVFVHG